MTAKKKTKVTARASKTRPPSERRARKAAVLRQRMIQCALKQFEKSGFTRASIDSITEAADVGKGTFYNYFDSKESLLAAWGRQLLRQAQQELAAEAEAQDEPALRRLFRLFSALLAPVQERPGLARPFVLAHLLMAPDTPAVSLPEDNSGEEAGPNSLLEMTLPIAEAALSQKVVRTDLDARRVAQTFIGVLYQSVLLLATGEGSETPREHLRSGLALALEGLAPAIE